MSTKIYTWVTEEILVTEEKAVRLKMIDHHIHRIETTLDGFQWNAGNATIEKHFAQLETLHRARRLVLFGDSQVHITLPKPANLHTSAQANWTDHFPAQVNSPAEAETPAQAKGTAQAQTPAQAKGEPILQTWTTTEGDGTPVFVVSIKRTKESIVPHQRRFEMRPEFGGPIKIGAEWKDRKDAIAITYEEMGLTPPTI